MHRKVDYLRISVTDRCNLRCSYCMPEGGIIPWPQSAILSFEEILRLVKILAFLGIKRVRLTGGEPLVRKGIVNLVREINQIKGIEEIGLTTNGLLLSDYTEDLKKAGVSNLNISLDTLKEERFRLITGDNCLCRLLKGIEQAVDSGFKSIKLNVVVMRQVNDDEIIDFVNFAQDKGLILRFIEFMKVTPLWDEKLFMPVEEIRDICGKKFNLKKAEYKSPGPAEYYQYSQGIIGFIKTHTRNCAVCSRLRLTAGGELKLCLYQDRGIVLRDLLRADTDDMRIRNIIKDLISLKEKVDYRSWKTAAMYMCSIGG